MAKAKLKKKKGIKAKSKGPAKSAAKSRGGKSARQSRLAQIFNPSFNVKTTREEEKVGKNVLQESSFYISGDLRRPVYNTGFAPRGTRALLDITGDIGDRGYLLNKEGKVEVSSRSGVDRRRTDIFNTAFSNYLGGRKQSAVKLRGKTYKADLVKENVFLKEVRT